MSVLNRLKNSSFYVFLFVFTVAYLASALTLGPPVANSRLTASFFPLILGSLSVVISFALLLKNLSVDQSAPPESEQLDDRHFIERNRALVVIAITAVFILAFQTLGFFVSSIPYVFVIIVIFSDLEKKKEKLFYSVVTVLLGYLLFAQVFNVRLPTLWD